jgi:hypothetical protein
MSEEKKIKEIVEGLKTIQHLLCAYGTKEGDGRVCDCKFVTPEWAEMYGKGEHNGCCEIRTAIWFIEKNFRTELKEDSRTTEG